MYLNGQEIRMIPILEFINRLEESENSTGYKPRQSDNEKESVAFDRFQTQIRRIIKRVPMKPTYWKSRLSDETFDSIPPMELSHKLDSWDKII